jgi:hypothetical protein
MTLGRGAMSRAAAELSTRDAIVDFAFNDEHWGGNLLIESRTDG